MCNTRSGIRDEVDILAWLGTFDWEFGNLARKPFLENGEPQNLWGYKETPQRQKPKTTRENKKQ